MNDLKLKTFEDSVNELAYRYEQTRSSHERLKKEHAILLSERDRLLEHNKLATDKIESMVSRLKAMEQQNV
ncbi:MAG: TIGR02449 family protein [Gammaproteobacteria bacterium CG22_combo_CG10-13_8_21_14_all_40_8]|nr:MAG: TIGR02449 family protein [Gammaproteobacteria bacterium CG22_combo_CG10-13_8_21_14_all_40_8]